MSAALIGLLFFAAESQNANLLLNPSFEEIGPDGRPAHWSAFVMAQPGALAETDPIAIEGSHAAMLHVPAPYEKEPANNWSQVVIADIAEKELTLSGEIRTEAVGRAALWLQCFTKNPARVIAAATSGTDRPIAGTNDWTPVTLRLTAPKETDFVVVRCVIKGQGSAWFDDLRLEAGTNAPQLAPIEPGPDTPATGDSTLRETDLEGLSKLLRQTIGELQKSNSRMLERVQQMQTELDRNRRAGSEAAPLEPPAVRHPLVPHNTGAPGELP